MDELRDVFFIFVIVGLKPTRSARSEWPPESRRAKLGVEFLGQLASSHRLSGVWGGAPDVSSSLIFQL